MDALAEDFRKHYGKQLGIIAELLITGFIMDKWSYHAAWRMADKIIAFLTVKAENVDGMGI